MIELKEIGSQSGDPKRNILKEDLQLGVIAFRTLIIPQPNPKLCASEKKSTSGVFGVGPSQQLVPCSEK